MTTTGEKITKFRALLDKIDLGRDRAQMISDMDQQRAYLREHPELIPDYAIATGVGVDELREWVAEG